MGIFQQFPYSNFHEFNLDQIIKIMRDMQNEWEATKTEWSSYKDYIDNYFENLDLDEETEKALRNLINAGELDDVIDPVIADEVAVWLAAHITPTTPIIDDTLSIVGAGADAKTTGDRFKDDEETLNFQETAFINGNLKKRGVDYPGIRIRPDNGEIDSPSGNVRTMSFPIENKSIIRVSLIYGNGRNINRCGISLSNNPVPTVGETPYQLIPGNVIISTDYEYIFSNSRNYKYCYVYYWTDTQAYTGNSKSNVLLNEYSQYIEREITRGVVNGGVIDGFDYPGIRIIPTTGVVESPSAYVRTMVFPILPKAKIQVNIKYDAASVNRCGISLSNNDTPTVDDVTYQIIKGNVVINADYEIEFVNSKNYNYMYVYYWASTGPYVGNSSNAITVRQKYCSSLLPSNLKVAIMGDSTSSYNGITESTVDGITVANPRYPTGDVDNFEKMWWEMVSRKLGISETPAVSGVAQSAYRLNPNNNTVPPSWNDERISNLAANGTPNLIIINMGINDGWNPLSNTNLPDFTYTPDVNTLDALSNSTTKGIALTIRKIQVAYPNAKIVLCIPKQVVSSANTWHYDMYWKTCEMIRRIGEAYGVDLIIDLRESGMTLTNMSTFTTDGIHENYKGMILVAEYIADEILKHLYQRNTVPEIFVPA